MDLSADAPFPSPAPACRKPWDLHPALSEERLRLCGRLLANARRDALAMASLEMGDDPWSVGCRAFAFGRQRLRRVAEAGTYPWLRVLDESHHFVFLIDQVPVRFYRGPAEEPNARTRRRHENEAQQLSLALGEEAADGLVFRFAVETTATGGVERVVFLALRGEDRTECFWPVPLEVPPAAAQGAGPVQLRLITDDGYAGPGRPDPAAAIPHEPASRRTRRGLHPGRQAGSDRG
jgi:hypothetical protein